MYIKCTLCFEKKEKEGGFMEINMNALERSAINFKKLPSDKKMFILGYMEGVLSSERKENKIRKEDIKEFCKVKQ